MRVLNMVMAAIAGFACAQLAAAWFVWMPQHEAHAYTRGYAAAVDSVRAGQRNSSAEMVSLLNAAGVRFDVVIALKGKFDSTTAIVHGNWSAR